MRYRLTAVLPIFLLSLIACSESPDPAQQPPGEQEPALSVITGEVFYRERIMLRPDAELRVTLEDVSRMDVASTRLAEQRQSLNGAPPYGFSLEYDAALIDSRMRYSVRAQIFEQGQLRFTSTEAINPFAEPGSPLTIMLSSAGATGSAPQADSEEPLATIDNTYWKLLSVADRKIVMAKNQQKEAHFQLRVGGEQVTGFGGCNSFTGTYTLSNDELSFGPLAATSMACMTGMDDEQAFYAVLAATRSYVIRQHNLILFDDSKQPLAKFEAVYFN